MSREVEALLAELGAEVGAAARTALARVYERGFRDGMATAGLTEDELARRAAIVRAPATERPPAGPGEAALALAPAPRAPLTEGVPAAPPAVDWDEPDDGTEEDSEPEPEEAASDGAPRPISARATVGTLLKRIERMFQLERFDVDVVVCRRGDRTRRQLKSTTRLGHYLRG